MKIQDIKNEYEFKEYVINDFVEQIESEEFKNVKNIDEFWEKYEDEIYDQYEYSIYNEDLINSLHYVFEECGELNDEYGLNIFDNIIDINGAILIYIKNNLTLENLTEVK